MITYQSRNQVQADLRRMLPHQIEECRECDELPQTLEQLIKHNFQAKFVCYNKKSNTIEVGVEKQEVVDSYPEITVHKFSLDEAVAKLSNTFRNKEQDLRFYGRLLARQSSEGPIEDVVLV